MLKRLSLFAFFSASAFAAPTPIKTYVGHQVFRVTVPDDSSVQLLKTASSVLGLDFWTDVKPGTVDVRVPPSVTNSFNKFNLKKSVLISDVEELIKKERLNYNAFASGGNFFSGYHDYATNLAWLKQIASNYSSLAQIVNIGTTYKNNQIVGIQITGKKSTTPKPAVVMQGTQHAREWISTMVNNYFVNLLLTKYGSDQEITTLVDTYEFTIIPVHNVDGFIYTNTNDRMHRKNLQPNPGSSCLGTDPNRNWDYKWNTGGSSADPCQDDYHGPSAGSAPETVAMQNFLKSKQNVQLYFDFHSYSQLWMVPYGYTCNVPAPNSATLKALAKGAAQALKGVHGTSFQSGDICNTIYQASGSSADWASAVAKIPYTFAVELRDTGASGFILPPSQIIPSGEETWAGVKYLLQTIASGNIPGGGGGSTGGGSSGGGSTGGGSSGSGCFLGIFC